MVFIAKYESKVAGETLFLYKEKYVKGNNDAYQLVNEEGEPWAVISINYPDLKLADNCFVAKEYSENEETMRELNKLNFFIDTKLRFNGNRILALNMDVISKYNK